MKLHVGYMYMIIHISHALHNYLRFGFKLTCVFNIRTYMYYM